MSSYLEDTTLVNMRRMRENHACLRGAGHRWAEHRTSNIQHPTSNGGEGGKATRSHLNATSKLIDSQPIATPKPPQGSTNATPMLPQSQASGRRAAERYWRSARGPEVECGKANIQHRTSNIQHRMAAEAAKRPKDNAGQAIRQRAERALSNSTVAARPSEGLMTSTMCSR